MSREVTPSQLRKEMIKAYPEEKFEILCLDLGTRYDLLRGKTLELKIAYLVEDYHETPQYEILVQKVIEDHPHLQDKLGQDDLEIVYTKGSLSSDTDSIDSLASQLEEWKVVHSRTQSLFISLERTESSLSSLKSHLTDRAITELEKAWMRYCEPKAEEIRDRFRDFKFISDFEPIQKLYDFMVGGKYIVRLIWSMKADDIESIRKVELSLYKLEDDLKNLLVIADYEITRIAGLIKEVCNGN